VPINQTPVVGNGDNGQEEVPTDTPEVEQQPTEAPPEPTSSGIEPTDNTPPPEDTETPEASPEETPTEEINGSGADLSSAETLIPLPGDASWTSGPFPAKTADDGAQFAVISTGGQLAAVNLASGDVIPIGPGASPMWSPLGYELLYASSPTTVSTWDRPSGAVNQMGSSDGGQTMDVPAGWIGEHLYYLRSFSDQPGHVELHQAIWDGSEDTIVWTADDVNMTSDHAVATDSAILIPTDTGWRSVTPSGDETSLGDNPYGAIGDATLSSDGSLIAYTSGGRLFVASSGSPGSPIFDAIYPDGGFDFSPDGTQIVSAGSDGLVTFSTSDGTQTAFIPNGDGMHATAPWWTSDGLVFIDAGASPPTLRRQPMS
jgi:hypothetical protein